MKDNIESFSYNDFWDEKPFWCQPWSILLTGIIVILISLWWPNRIWITSILSILILLWWILFLLIAPIAYSNLNKTSKDIV